MSGLAWARDRLRAFGEAPFVLDGEDVLTYAAIDRELTSWLTRLDQAGVEPGDSVAFIGDYSAGSIALFLALLLNGNVAVPLTPEVGPRRDKFLDIVEARGFFEPDGQGELQWRPRAAQRRHPLLNRLRQTGEAGVVIFSSGTTGESKASLLQASRLFDKHRDAKPKPLRTLIFLKPDHIGGVNTLFSIMFTGGALVLCGDRSPRAICAAIARHQVQLLPTTPTFLNMLILSEIYRDHDLSSLEVVTYGAEPMPQSTLTAVNRVFPEVRLKQTYGLTELGIFSTKSRDSASTWMKVGGPGVETKIVDGTLWVRAKAAMLGYLNAPSPFDEDGWYNTNDKVEVDGEHLRILGREQDIINVGGEKVFPAEIESLLLEMPGVREAVVRGKKNPITGQVVTAVLTLDRPEDLNSLRKRVFAFCQGRLERFKIPAVVSVADNLVSDRFKKIRAL